LHENGLLKDLLPSLLSKFQVELLDELDEEDEELFALGSGVGSDRVIYQGVEYAL
jgi:hypothetical protein